MEATQIQFFLVLILYTFVLQGRQLTYDDRILINWESIRTQRTEDKRRIHNHIQLEYTEYFFKSSSEIIPVRCYTKIESISNKTTSTMCRSLESHQEICLECHYSSFDKKFVRYHDEVGKYVRMAIPPSGFVCMPREIAAGCDVEKIGRYVATDVAW